MRKGQIVLIVTPQREMRMSHGYRGDAETCKISRIVSTLTYPVNQLKVSLDNERSCCWMLEKYVKVLKARR